MNVTIDRSKSIRSIASVPGDKSIALAGCGVRVQSNGNAMAAAIAGLAARGETRLLDAECVGVLFRQFFSKLRDLGGLVA